MPKKKNKKSKKHVRKLTGMGDYSLYVTLPKKVVRELRWRKGQKLVLKKYGKGILITDWDE